MIHDGMTSYIRNVEVTSRGEGYPFNLRAVENLPALEFHPNVTFIVGENGSGKSTLLEAIAVAFGFNAEGGSKNFNFSTKATHSVLHEHIRLSKGVVQPKDGFFLRAESFYNVASNLESLDMDPGLLAAYGGKSLHEQSHGESFMALSLHRFRGRGLYILDEPEAALSPTRQMAMLSRIHQLVEDDSQFIIATHSPILMAYPHARIYDVERDFAQVAYKETDHYRITREFLNHPEELLDMLLRAD